MPINKVYNCYILPPFWGDSGSEMMEEAFYKAVYGAIGSHPILSCENWICVRKNVHVDKVLTVLLPVHLDVSVPADPPRLVDEVNKPFTPCQMLVCYKLKLLCQNFT